MRVDDGHNAAFMLDFRAVASRIRSRYLSQDSWEESVPPEMLVHDEDIQARFFMLSDYRGEGRVAAFIRPEEESGYLGWYECDADQDVANELLQAAFQWLREQGKMSCVGPIQGSTWFSYRFNLSGASAHFSGEPAQPLHYPQQWLDLGFEQRWNYETSFVEGANGFTPCWDEMIAHFAEFGIRIESYPSALSGESLERYHDFYELCFQSNPHFHSLTRSSFAVIFEKASPKVEYANSYALLGPNDELVGTFVSFQDQFNKVPSRTYIKTIAIHPEWRNRFIGQYMIRHMMVRAEELGFERTYFSLMYSENLSAVKGKSNFGAKQERAYALYSKQL